jgi:hypothetical protein
MRSGLALTLGSFSTRRLVDEPMRLRPPQISAADRHDSLTNALNVGRPPHTDRNANAPSVEVPPHTDRNARQ